MLCFPAMTCPSCGIINLSTADKCECGYVLKGSQTNPLMYLGSIDKSLRTIKRIAIWWLILSIAAVAASVLYVVNRS